MTDENAAWVNGALCSFMLTALVAFIVCMTLTTSARVDAENRMEKQAVYYGYGEYSKNGGFLWKDEIEKENFLKDLEFFQRNEKKMKEQLVPNIPFPSNKIDPTQPF
jgi:hypothetical protein